MAAAVKFNAALPCAAPLSEVTSDAALVAADDVSCPQQVTVVVRGGGVLAVQATAPVSITRLRFHVEERGVLAFSGEKLTLLNSKPQSMDTPEDPGLSGGAIHSAGRVTFDGPMYFGANQAEGGAIYNAGGVIDFSDEVSFGGNQAAQVGGAMYLGAGGNVTIGGNSTFVENYAKDGGACAVVASSVSFDAGATFSTNSATGGALMVQGASAVDFLADAVFSGNNAAQGGGNDIWIDTGSVVFGAQASFDDKPTPSPEDIAGPGAATNVRLPSDAPTATPPPTPAPAPPVPGTYQASYTTTLVGQAPTTFTDDYERVFVGVIGAAVVQVDGAANARVINATYAAAMRRRLRGGGAPPALRLLQAASDSVDVSYVVADIENAAAVDAVTLELQQQSANGQLLSAYSDAVAADGLSAATITATSLATGATASVQVPEAATPTSSGGDSGGTSVGLVVGIVIGVLAVVAAVGGALWWRRRKNRQAGFATAPRPDNGESNGNWSKLIRRAPPSDTALQQGPANTFSMVGVHTNDLNLGSVPPAHRLLGRGSQMWRQSYGGASVAEPLSPSSLAPPAPGGAGASSMYGASIAGDSTMATRSGMSLLATAEAESEASLHDADSWLAALTRDSADSADRGAAALDMGMDTVSRTDTAPRSPLPPAAPALFGRAPPSGGAAGPAYDSYSAEPTDMFTEDTPTTSRGTAAVGSAEAAGEQPMQSVSATTAELSEGTGVSTSASQGQTGSAGAVTMAAVGAAGATAAAGAAFAAAHSGPEQELADSSAVPAELAEGSSAGVTGEAGAADAGARGGEGGSADGSVGTTSGSAAAASLPAASTAALADATPAAYGATAAPPATALMAPATAAAGPVSTVPAGAAAAAAAAAVVAGVTLAGAAAAVSGSPRGEEPDRGASSTNLGVKSRPSSSQWTSFARVAGLLTPGSKSRSTSVQSHVEDGQGAGSAAAARAAPAEEVSWAAAGEVPVTSSAAPAATTDPAPPQPAAQSTTTEPDADAAAAQQQLAVAGEGPASMTAAPLSRTTTKMSEIAREGQRRYGRQADCTWGAAGAPAGNLPYARDIYGICNEVVLLFGAACHINDNCREVARWASSMQTTLDTLQRHLDNYPGTESALDLDMMDVCERHLQELVVLARRHSSSSMLAQFALSRKTQRLIDEASRAFTHAIQKLQLGLGVKVPGINLRIDENVSLLLSAMDEVQVRLSTFASAFNRLERRISADGADPWQPRQSSIATAGDATAITETLSAKEAPEGRSGTADDDAAGAGEPGGAMSEVSSITASRETDGSGATAYSALVMSAHEGDGPTPQMQELARIMDDMQVLPTSFRKLERAPVGRGGSALVYKVEHMGQTRAAKVMRLGDLMPEQLQKVFVKFTRELYILATLRHPRVVDVVGCAADTTHLTILMEYMPRGSLRRVLDTPDVWSQFTPFMRHQVLLDIVGAMVFLHSQNVYHRDLKSHNILLTDFGRAKLSDFGLSRTTDAISSFTGKSTLGGGTVAWMAPERFASKRSKVVHTAASDVYSYGICVWEVLSGLYGHDRSAPWAGMSIVEIISAVVVRHERPELPAGALNPANVHMAEQHAALMRQCWEAEPGNRPTFAELHSQLVLW